MHLHCLDRRFGSVLIVSVIAGGAELRELEKECGVASYSTTFAVWRITGLLFLVMSVTLALTTNYIHDATRVFKINEVMKTYWFSELVAPDVVRLNSLGFYYFLLNFLLLLFTIISLTCFMSTAGSTYRVARSLACRTAASSVAGEAERIRVRLHTFMGAYLAAKSQVAVYVVNVWLWQQSSLGSSSNTPIAIILLAVVSWFFLSIPRSFIELQWHRYKDRFKLSDEELDLNALFSTEQVVWSWVLDFFFIGGIALPFLSRWLPKIEI